MTSETREYYLEATAGVRVKTGDLVEKGQVIGVDEQGSEVKTPFDARVILTEFDGLNHQFVVRLEKV